MNVKIILSLFVLGVCLSFSKKEDAETILNELLDGWHENATQAKLEPYFTLMDTSFVFLGTAPGERWDKATFYSFCKPYFDAGKAWDFKPNNRHWYFSKNNKTAWFEEDLDTWMLGCRGSGVFQKIKGEWKLYHYNLTVLIENEKVDGFIDLRLQKEEKEKVQD